MSAAKRWCFTLNNWSPAEQQQILDGFPDTFSYLIVGRETGESGTHHLQGFFILHTKLRLRQVRLLGGLQRAHLENARGSPQEASLYCKKEGNFDEHGDLPSGQGRRTDFERLKEWIQQQESIPNRRALAEAFPSLYGRYRQSCLEFVELFGPRPQLVDGLLRPWQQELDQRLSAEPDDRSVLFYVNPEGNIGKSWLTRYWMSKRDDLQRLSIGRRDDLAFAIDVSKRLFVFDIPRGSMEYLQYNILEQLKDQMVFSPKYQSATKILPHPVHVIVFTNENPDLTKMTPDRYKIFNI